MGNFNRLKSLMFLPQFGGEILRLPLVFIRSHTSENASKTADYLGQTVCIRMPEKPPTGKRMGEWMGDRAAGAIEALLVGLLLVGLGLALSL